MRQSESGPFYYDGDVRTWSQAEKTALGGGLVVCSVCHEPVIAVLTGKEARRLNLRTGIYCRNGHFSRRCVLNPFPDQEIWEPDDPELDPAWVPGEVSDLSP